MVDLTKKETSLSSPTIISRFMSGGDMAIADPFAPSWSSVAAVVNRRIWMDLHDAENEDLLISLLGLEYDDDRVLYPLAVYMENVGVEVEDLDHDVIDRFRESFIGCVNLKDWLVDAYCEALACRGADRSMIDFCVNHLDVVSFMFDQCDGVIHAAYPFTGLSADHYDYNTGGFSVAGGRAEIRESDLDRDFLLFWDIH